MSNPVNSIGNQNPPSPAGGTNAPATAPAATTATTPQQPDFKSQVASTVQSTAPHDSDAPISPRIVVDPLAGPITEFLTTSGQVQAQIPSAAVVAYLRAGLTAEGYAKPTPETTTHTDSTANVSDNNTTNSNKTGAPGETGGSKSGNSVVA